MLHSRVIPDEVGGLILISGLDEDHLVDNYANCGENELIILLCFDK